MTLKSMKKLPITSALTGFYNRSVIYPISHTTFDAVTRSNNKQPLPR